MLSEPDWGKVAFNKSCGLDPRVNSSSQMRVEGKPTGRDIADCGSHNVQERANRLGTFVRGCGSGH
jgi:hypothetical protein